LGSSSEPEQQRHFIIKPCLRLGREGEGEIKKITEIAKICATKPEPPPLGMLSAYPLTWKDRGTLLP